MNKNLEELIDTPSHTNNVLGVVKMGNIVQNILSDLPITWTSLSPVLPNELGQYAPMLLGKSNRVEGMPTIALSGHLDTVFPQHLTCRSGQQGNKLYGPGSIDMKSGLVVMLEVARWLIQQNKCNVLLILSTDEEQMSLSRFDFASICQAIDYLLVYEGDSINGEYDATKHAIVIERKGFVGCKLTAKASGGHSGVLTNKLDRHSAVHELVLKSAEILNLSNFELGTTTNLGQFNGGTAVNVLAQTAEIRFDARAKERSEYERIVKAYKQLSFDKHDPDVQLDLEILNLVPPLSTNEKTRKLLEQITLFAKQLGIELIEQYRGGGSDANRLSYYNPNMVVLDGLGPIGGGEHTTDEFVYLDSIEPSIRLSKLIVQTICDNLSA